eukprot:5152837-Prymnesium_polylepis.1
MKNIVERPTHAWCPTGDMNEVQGGWHRGGGACGAVARCRAARLCAARRLRSQSAIAAAVIAA